MTDTFYYYCNITGYWLLNWLSDVCRVFFVVFTFLHLCVRKFTQTVFGFISRPSESTILLKMCSLARCGSPA